MNEWKPICENLVKNLEVLTNVEVSEAQEDKKYICSQ